MDIGHSCVTLDWFVVPVELDLSSAVLDKSLAVRWIIMQIWYQQWHWYKSVQLHDDVLLIGIWWYVIIMDNLQLSSASRKSRRRSYARKIESELACIGDRLRCGCRACKFYRREHWGLSALSSSEESSSEDEEADEREDKGYKPWTRQDE